jgi:hypothetical protein
LSDLGAPGFDGRIERCPVGNIEWCEDFRGNAVSGRQRLAWNFTGAHRLRGTIDTRAEALKGH